MQLADLLSETVDEDSQDVWENERTPTSVHTGHLLLYQSNITVQDNAKMTHQTRVTGAGWNCT